MISCLMVTQPQRFALAQLAIADFAAQTHAARELVVLHDADAEFHARMQAVAAEHAAVRVMAHESGATLGRLRNAAVEAACGEYICQWDDDDRYHPQRLALQWQALREANATFCFLSDQLHWFASTGEMYWDDWDRETYPMNLVQGTLLGRRDRMPAYPDCARGEDTGLLHAILRRGDTIARLRDVGWCYVYVYHGGNVWDMAHHAAIPRAKALRQVALLQREGTLRKRLIEYQPGFGTVRFAHEGGHLTFADGAA